MIFKIKEELFSDGKKRYLALSCSDENENNSYGLYCKNIKQAKEWIEWQKSLIAPTIIKEKIIMEEKYERP